MAASRGAFSNAPIYHDGYCGVGSGCTGCARERAELMVWALEPWKARAEAAEAKVALYEAEMRARGLDPDSFVRAE